TNGCISDVAIVWARLNGEVRGFIIDKGTKGFSTSTMKGKFSLRVSVTSELHMQDCIVPKENILPNGKGLKAPLGCLTQARYGSGWGVVGGANGCFDTALSYSKARAIFDGKHLSDYQLAQAKLVKMVQEITKGKLLAIQAGRLKEAGKLQP